jgi:glycosyltransferase involved in cell wall biosynthesis
MKFIGANLNPSEQNRLIELTKNLSNIEILDRIDRADILDEMQKTDILLLTTYNNLFGVYPAKLFEYYASGTPILLCPSDNDIMESFIKKTNCGVGVNSVIECEEVLLNWANAKMNGKPIVFERNIEEGKKYSREYQTYKLASYLDEFSDNPK